MSSVANVTPRHVVEMSLRSGVDGAALLAAAGLRPERLTAERLFFDEAAALCEQAAARSRDPHFALHAAEALPFGAFRTLDFLIAVCATAGAAVEKAAGYHRLLNTALDLCLSARRGEVRLELRAASGGEVPRFYAEYILANTRLRLGLTTGRAWHQREVHFMGPAPRDTREHQRIFGKVRFDQPVDRMILDPGLLALPQPGADPELAEILELRARGLGESLVSGPSLVREVEGVLRERLPKGNLGLAGLARELGLSARTLQRRLAEQGTAYREVLDRARRSLAQGLLRGRRMPAKEVAAQLGFSEPSALHRALRRWAREAPAVPETGAGGL